MCICMYDMCSLAISQLLLYQSVVFAAVVAMDAVNVYIYIVVVAVNVYIYIVVVVVVVVVVATGEIYQGAQIRCCFN